MKNKLPAWFEGMQYEKGDTVKNPFSGEECELNATELSMYDFIIGSQMVMEMTPKMITGLSKDKIMTIMKNYSDLNDRYGN